MKIYILKFEAHQGGVEYMLPNILESFLDKDLAIESGKLLLKQFGNITYETVPKIYIHILDINEKAFTPNIELELWNNKDIINLTKLVFDPNNEIVDIDIFTKEMYDDYIANKTGGTKKKSK